MYLEDACQDRKKELQIFRHYKATITVFKILY